MITIEHLEVLFDAERERDEARFAELFARHMAGHDDEHRRAVEAEARAAHERSPQPGSNW